MNDQLQSALAQGATVVTATRRLARSLWLEHSAAQQEQGATTWASPAILPWSGWLARLWEDLLYSSERPPVRLGAWQELALWQRVVRESADSSELLQLEATAAEVRDAWALATEWRLDIVRVEALANADAQAFAGWARRFRDICEREGWLEEARVPDLLTRSLAGIRLPARVVLAGFDELTPQQRDFLAACGAAGCAVQPLELLPAGPDGKAVRVSSADPEQEIASAARWARSLLESGASVLLGVVVPDLAARRDAVERTFRAILEPATQLASPFRPSKLVNLSAGNALSHYPVIRSALSILDLSPDANDWGQLSAFMRDPYLAGADTERTRRGLLDARLRSSGDFRPSLSKLISLCADEVAPCPSLARALEAWRAARSRLPARQAPGEWSRAFSSLLEAVGWPGERPLRSDEYQTVQAWSDVLSEFASTDLVTGAITFGDATTLLRRVAAGTMFQPENEDAPVQILGALEASGLIFDHLWIAGLDDEAWPTQPRPNPFLPVSLQRQAALPHSSPARELEFARRMTARLLAASPDVVVSHATHDEDQERAPSPLIVSIPQAPPGCPTLWNGPGFAETIWESRGIEQLTDEQGPPLGEATWQRGGTKVFQHQSTCPFRAFAELRLGAEDLECPQPGLDARQRGILVHAALEEFWRDVRTQQALLERDDIAEVARRAIRAAVARLEQRRGAPLPSRFAALEQQRLERLVGDWLELEQARCPFEVVEPEGERYAEVSGVRCRIKIDRVDRLSNGRELIIDYKTGSPKIGDWETDRPAEPQLPLYATVHEAPLAGVLFARLAAGEACFRGLADDGVEIAGATPTDLATQVEAWRAVLLRLGSEFRAGRAEANPREPDKDCSRCALVCLCRMTASEDVQRDQETRP